MELIIVHLTDLHIKDQFDLNILLPRTDSISGVICNHITDSKNTIILFCITGDLVFSGKAEQYTLVESFLDKIFSEIEMRFSETIIHIVFIPGNHDCNFDISNSVRDLVLLESNLNILDSSHIEQGTSIQKEFFNFVDTYKNKEKRNIISCQKDKILTTKSILLDHKNRKLKVHCINTSWCSKLNEEKGKMKLGFNIEEIKKDENDIVITLLHHSAEWLDWDSKEFWNEYCNKFPDIILVGHDHSIEYVRKVNYDESSNYHIKGNQLYSSERPDQSGFNILKIDISKMQEYFFGYKWDTSDQCYLKDIVNVNRPFVKNRFISSGIQLKKNMKDFIETVNIDLPVKSGNNLKLSHIFGYPTLKIKKGESSIEFLRSQKELMSFISEKNYIVIEGNREIGKTSLLKQLFNEFYLLKKYPIFLDIEKFNTCDGEELNDIIQNAYSEHYENINAQIIMQKTLEDRICFIDNFDNIQLSTDSTKKIIDYLKLKFSVVIIAQTSKFGSLDLMNNINFMDVVAYLKNKDFCFMEIQPVRNLQKKRIIEKWLLSTKSNQDNTSIEFNQKIRDKINQVDTIMKNKYFNRTPVDFLLVLSYLEQDSIIQMDYSRYSYVYDALILNKLNCISNKHATVASMYKTILEQISFTIYKSLNQGCVNYNDLVEIIQDYRNHYPSSNTRIDTIINNLVDNNLLEEVNNNNFKFKFNYMYYYFISRHINGLSDMEKKKVIGEIFQNLHLEVNYNIALFLAYTLNFEYDVIPIVEKYCDKLLLNYNLFRYEDMKKSIQDLGVHIEDKINKTYSVPKNNDIIALSEYKMIQYDIIEEQGETETKADYNKKIEAANMEIIKTQRFITFIGNVLKNHSGKIRNEIVEKTLDLIFKNTFKVMGAVLDFSTFLINKIIQILEEKLEENKRIKIKSEFIAEVKKVFGEFYYELISAIINMLALSLENETIKDIFDKYCREQYSDFVRMVRLEYLIRISGTRLPVNEIKLLFVGKEKLEKFSQSIMKQNIYYYLCDYPYNKSDKQSVCSLLGFSIGNVLIEEQKLKIVLEE